MRLVNDDRPARESVRPGKRWLTLALVYLACAAAGYALGFGGFVPSGISGKARLTPEARVGFALGQPHLSGSDQAWRQLGGDLGTVRQHWDPAAQPLYDLVVAVRGFEARGAPDLDRAALLCGKLGWSRCDPESLQELAKRSRP